MKIGSIEDLRVLVETARTGSFTAASRVMGVTPAAASAMLKRLETQLGSRLFERSTRSMRLTSQGKTLLGYAASALELLQEGESQLASANQTLLGTIRVAAPSDLTRSVLLPWLSEFLRLNPGVMLKLSVSDQVQDVMRDTIDVALRYGELRDSCLVARRLSMTRRVLCAAPEYLKSKRPPKHPQELTQYNCLTFQINGLRYVNWRFEKNNEWTEVQIDGDRNVDDAAIAHQWALAGAGLIYKAELDLIHNLQSGLLVRLLPDWRGEYYPLNAILPSTRFVPARVRALVDFLAIKFESIENQNPGFPGASGLKR